MERNNGKSQSQFPPQPILAWESPDQSKSAADRRKNRPIRTANRDDLIERVSVKSIRHGVDTSNDDGAGCSSWNREISDQAEVDDTPKDEEETKKNDPLENAWTDLVERVSVAGWKEAFDEKILWIRGIYVIVLTILSIVCVYYICASVRSWIRSGYVDQISDFARNESLPFPNVTICAQVYFNQTFLRHNLTIPNRTMEILRHHNIVSMDDFYRQLAIYLTPVIRPRNISAANRALFSKVIAANPQVEDYSSFAAEAWLRCESTLKRCWLGGVEFDCCSKTVTSFDDDGICFQLALNMDSDNAFPDQRTFQQTTPGPNGGLDVEVSLDTRHFPWLEDDAQNGFRILVGHTPVVDYGTPVVAPHGAQTFIKVTPERRVLATECAGKNQLRLPFKNDLGYYYDPDGIACGLHTAQNGIFLKYTSCQVAIYTYRPNRTIVCPPVITYGATSLIADTDPKNGLIETLGKGSPDSDKAIKKMMDLMEALMHSFMSEKAMCPKHCDRWTYSSTTSFFYLENENTKEKDQGRMYSKLRIYYANLEYRQHAEVKETTLYLAFCDFGNIVGLYWGMSIASFFHVFYYVPRYLYVRRQRRGAVISPAPAPVNILVEETSL